MSTNTDQEQTTVETAPSSTVSSNETEVVSSKTDENSTVASSTTDQPAVVEEKKSSSASSWFNNFAIPPNLTNQLTNLSSSLIQVTSKVSAAANTLVQKTLPQRPTSPVENQSVEGTNENDNEQQTNSDDNKGTNKDITGLYL